MVPRDPNAVRHTWHTLPLQAMGRLGAARRSSRRGVQGGGKRRDLLNGDGPLRQGKRPGACWMGGPGTGRPSPETDMDALLGAEAAASRWSPHFNSTVAFQVGRAGCEDDGLRDTAALVIGLTHSSRSGVGGKHVALPIFILAAERGRARHFIFSGWAAKNSSLTACAVLPGLAVSWSGARLPPGGEKCAELARALYPDLGCGSLRLL